MKRLNYFTQIISSVIVISVIAMLSGCVSASDSDENITTTKHKVIVRANTPEEDGADTRVKFAEKSEGVYSVLWEGDETFAIAEFSDDDMDVIYNVTSSNISDDGHSCDIEFEFPWSWGDVFSYYSVCGDVDEFYYEDFTYKTVSVNIPASQKQSKDGLVDSKAVLMFAKSEEHQGRPEELDLKFEHITAYGHLMLKGLPKGETIKKVSFNTASHISGKFEYDWESNELKPHSDNENQVTVDVSDIEPDKDGIFHVWFAIRPMDNISQFSVTVDNKTKEIDATGHDLSFKAGQISKFGVNMQSAS